jgi:hypothetical protein
MYLKGIVSYYHFQLTTSRTRTSTSIIVIIDSLCCPETIFIMQLLFPAVALLASVASAANCQKDLKYCAYTLVGKGSFPSIAAYIFAN